MTKREGDKWEVIAEILLNIKKYAEEEAGSQGVLCVAYLDQYLKKCYSPTKIKRIISRVSG